MSHEFEGRPLRLDPEAESADPDLPAFIARPADARVYHGFPVLEDVAVDGFTLGMIDDWEAEPALEGDAFVLAPDGSPAGLMWYVILGEDSYGRSPGEVSQASGFELDRWGVWHVNFPHRMDSQEHARMNLEAVLPLLRPRWEEWRTWVETRSRPREPLWRRFRARFF